MRSFMQAAALGRTQHGVVSRRQLLDAGFSTEEIRLLRNTGRLEPLHPQAYAVAGAPRIWEQMVIAALLAAGEGSYASHRSAARLWGLLDQDDIDVTTHRHPRIFGVHVHRRTGERAVTTRSGIRVSSPSETLVDLGAVTSFETVERCVDLAISKRLASRRSLLAAYWAVAARGRSGAGVLRKVLERRDDSDDVAESILEARMLRLLRRAGLPTPVCQFIVRDGRRFVARVDFAYPAARLIIEVDGFDAHATAAQLRRDLERQNQLVALGYTVLRFTWRDIADAPDRVIATIAGFLRPFSVA